MKTKPLAFLSLAVFGLSVFLLGIDSAEWKSGAVDNGQLTSLVIHAFAAFVFCLILVRQIHRLKDV
mgnify:CR=1 FL=1